MHTDYNLGPDGNEESATGNIFKFVDYKYKFNQNPSENHLFIPKMWFLGQHLMEIRRKKYHFIFETAFMNAWFSCRV